MAVSAFFSASPFCLADVLSNSLLPNPHDRTVKTLACRTGQCQPTPVAHAPSLCMQPCKQRWTSTRGISRPI